MSIASLDASRETIYSALASDLGALVASQAPAPLGQLISFSRRLKHWSQVDLEQQPALFQVQRKERSEKRTGMPPKWIFDVDLYLYVNVGNNELQIPTTIVNPLMDAIEAIFYGQSSFYKRLGGIVTEARIVDVTTDEGVLGPQAVQIIATEIVATY